ncbi:hypothetical protein MUK42_24699 [Musa troglodytarum]|uniref:Uncharacterized protein n=1 Tax=Musa troglodytarum TaxID=320322 RepID=A0A9E7GBE1_9LILI|nr:hypothetical protein MUK42_24699 [Musa troglodytarum]
MGWCSHCVDDCPTIRDPDKGYICCAICGRILDEDIYFTGPTFAKDSSGQSRFAGSIMHSVQSGYSASHERTLMKGRDEIRHIVDSLRVGGGDSIINKAHAFYQIAVDKNFTKGRRTSHVAAACLYIACRCSGEARQGLSASRVDQEACFIGASLGRLPELSRLSASRVDQEARFIGASLGHFPEPSFLLPPLLSCAAPSTVKGEDHSFLHPQCRHLQLPLLPLLLSATAAAIDSSVRRCCRLKVSVVHVCEATLTKRLIEFENTESGSLTIEEFLARADELNAESESDQLPKAGKVLCKHKDSEVPHFAHGLCRKCYDKFIKISGGLQGGAEPPAFQQAERQRMFRPIPPGTGGMYRSNRIPDKENGSAKFPDIDQAEGKTTNEPESAGDKSLDSEQQDLDDTADDETENFSDIDDVEVDGYLHNEEEKELKKIIWEEMNKEYLEEQAAKEAAAAAAKEAYEANFADGTEDVLAAKELAEATAAALAKSRKERKKRRAEESKNAAPAQTPLEATRQMLKKKTFSSKVNYEALEALYTPEQDNGKKQKIESDAADPCNLPDNIENHVVDPGATEDGERPEAFEDHNFAEVSYDDYNGIGDEDYGYDEDFDFS